MITQEEVNKARKNYESLLMQYLEQQGWWFVGNVDGGYWESNKNGCIRYSEEEAYVWELLNK